MAPRPCSLYSSSGPVETVSSLDHVLAERFNAGRVAQVEAEDLHTVAPLFEVGFGGVPGGGITGEPGGDDERRPAAK